MILNIQSLEGGTRLVKVFTNTFTRLVKVKIFPLPSHRQCVCVCDVMFVISTVH